MIAQNQLKSGPRSLPQTSSRMDCNASVELLQHSPRPKTPLSHWNHLLPKSFGTRHWNGHHKVALRWYQQNHESDPHFAWATKDDFKLVIDLITIWIYLTQAISSWASSKSAKCWAQKLLLPTLLPGGTCPAMMTRSEAALAASNSFLAHTSWS